MQVILGRWSRLRCLHTPQEHGQQRLPASDSRHSLLGAPLRLITCVSPSAYSVASSLRPRACPVGRAVFRGKEGLKILRKCQRTWLGFLL